MPQHRVNTSTVSVRALLSEQLPVTATPATMSEDAGNRVAHRIQPRTGRIRLAAGVAVAAGALIGTAGQIAHAAPAPTGHDHNDSDPLTLETAPEPLQQAQDVDHSPRLTPEPATTASITAPGQTFDDAPALPADAAVSPTAADPAPFGLHNLPPEVLGPLQQAQQVLRDMQAGNAQPSAQPVMPPVNGPVTSGFGARPGGFHYGADFADAPGAPVHAIRSGTVVQAGDQISVAHDDGTTAVYDNVGNAVAAVGQRVTAGDIVGALPDSTADNDIGPAVLHVEVWDSRGAKIDPASYLGHNGVVVSQSQWGPGQE